MCTREMSADVETFGIETDAAAVRLVVARRCWHDRRMTGTGRVIGETMAKGDGMLLLRFRNNRVASSSNMIIILLTYVHIILYYIHCNIIT